MVYGICACARTLHCIYGHLDRFLNIPFDICSCRDRRQYLYGTSLYKSVHNPSECHNRICISSVPWEAVPRNNVDLPKNKNAEKFNQYNT